MKLKHVIIIGVICKALTLLSLGCWVVVHKIKDAEQKVVEQTKTKGIASTVTFVSDAIYSPSHVHQRLITLRQVSYELIGDCVLLDGKYLVHMSNVTQMEVL